MAFTLLLAMLVQAAPPAASPASPDAAAKDRQICRSQRTTGTRLTARKICRTAREWDEDRAAARRRTDTIQHGAINS